ncbi:uncharacterized protein LAESUDRAFT_754024 [Laetiporus sulphureus 93-53]|uniref:C2 domain-containing protein n=1 Tax=Laetiporus sulphureus 93-53 TaxID=1314785 RepID=A0A165IFA1_9APHY|nr:uncharacterized protein LAESUDRAFT_754024 [Laetiporus sulphureus 93-53]KZT12994.1 hypothetical protein LAESUDRAFT_754024 [Laetiporus sulphureus 93-53]
MVATNPREIGTLVVVVLKARNLPNKRHIGKQDPFCSIVFNEEKRRTKAIKRGGQHPEWDEEFRFTLVEDDDDEATSSQFDTSDRVPPPLPPKSGTKGPPRVKGGRSMAIACYADDPREPDLIGDCTADLTEVLTKGETDEWFVLMNKDKYCGEVYLEMTFWSNEPEPLKKVTPKPKTKKLYGGPGSFVPAEEPSMHSGLDVQHEIRRLPSNSNMRDSLRLENIPRSLRPSASFANLDLYVPPYESSRTRHTDVESVATEFADLGVGDHANGRLNFPPQQPGYLPRPTSSHGYSDALSQTPSQHGFHQGSYLDGSAPSHYNAPDPPAPVSYQQEHVPAEPYQPPYEPAPPSTFHASARPTGPRQGVSAASSGFMPIPMPIPTSAPSGFGSFSSYPSQSSGFAAGPATAAPSTYGYPPSHHPTPSSSFSTLPPQPVTSSGFAPLPPSRSHHHSLPQPPVSSGFSSQSYVQYPTQHVPPAPSASAPPHQHVSQEVYVPPPPPSVPPHSYSAPPEPFPITRTSPSPPLDNIPPPPPLNGSFRRSSPPSRPLPQPGTTNGQPHPRRTSLPVPPPGGPQGIYDPQRTPPKVFGSGSLGQLGSYGTPRSPPQAFGSINGQNGMYDVQRSPPQTYNSSLMGLPGSYNSSSNASMPFSSNGGVPSRGNSGSYTSSSQLGLYMQPNGSASAVYNHPEQSRSMSSIARVDPVNPPSDPYDSIPPPPPLPSEGGPVYVQNNQLPVARSSPPLPQSQHSRTSLPRTPSLSVPLQPRSRHISLPAPPPMGLASQPSYHTLPPPPAPPSMPSDVHYEPVSTFPSANLSQTFHPGPPPRPPAQINPQPRYVSSPITAQSYNSVPPLGERDGRW